MTSTEPARNQACDVGTARRLKGIWSEGPGRFWANSKRKCLCIQGTRTTNGMFRAVDRVIAMGRHTPAGAVSLWSQGRSNRKVLLTALKELHLYLTESGCPVGMPLFPLTKKPLDSRGFLCQYRSNGGAAQGAPPTPDPTNTGILDHCQRAPYFFRWSFRVLLSSPSSPWTNQSRNCMVRNHGPSRRVVDGVDRPVNCLVRNPFFKSGHII